MLSHIKNVYFMFYLLSEKRYSNRVLIRREAYFEGNGWGVGVGYLSCRLDELCLFLVFLFLCPSFRHFFVAFLFPVMFRISSSALSFLSHSL